MTAGTSPRNILSRIVEARRAAVAHRQRVLPLVALKIAVEKKAPPARNFHDALTPAPWNIIAELKKASPSRGLLREEYQPAVLAPLFEQAGAAAISVLTEEDFFQGSLAHLKEARQAAQIPILRKDFIVDPWQVWEARAAGADSFLLIVAILTDDELNELLVLGRQLGMEPLTEVHTREELARAIEAGASIIGVNNRNLRSLEVRLETSFELVEAIPEDCVAVSESGIRSRDDLERLSRAGFDAFLIGEHLMSHPDPGEALREFVAAALPKRAAP
ncbi:MAG: indole-3-glycerol phosphate synthase TrpC [Candidatus Acidiferrales bacterium]